MGVVSRIRLLLAVTVALAGLSAGSIGYAASAGDDATVANFAGLSPVAQPESRSAPSLLALGPWDVHAGGALPASRTGSFGRFDALVAIGAVIRGDTYHFEVVSNESARGVMDVALEFGIPVANGILTTDDEEQALARADKGAEAVRVAVEMARLRSALTDAWR